MSKFRKRPVVVEAFQFDGDCINSNGEWYVPEWARNALESGSMYFGSPCDDEPPYELYINTLEGTMRAAVGDYVIRGVNGEIYPCKPDIFAKTYEPADVSAADVAPVVRCKDCSKKGTDSCPLYGGDEEIADKNDCTEDDGFCSLGARMYAKEDAK